MTYTMKTTKHSWKKLMNTQINENTSSVCGSEDSILLSCPYYSKQSPSSSQSLSKS